MASTDPQPSGDAEAPAGTAAARRPADRYGDRPPGRRPVALAAVGALVVAALALLGWLGWHILTPGVSAALVGYRIDGRDVHVQLEVVKDAGATAVCRVRAQDRQANTIGTTEVRVGPPRYGHRSVVEVLVRTSGQPVDGDLVGCTPA